MGLAQKRAFEDFKQSELPKLTKKLEDAAGCKINLDIRWDTIVPNSGGPEDYPEWLTKIYFTPLLTAIKAIAVDDMGKKALKEGLKKVVIDGSEGYSPDSFSFSGGELLLKHRMDSNIDEVDARSKKIQKLLEDSL